MTQVPTPRRRRLTRLALGLSLALNVMILGALGGAMWRHGGPGPRGDGDLPLLRILPCRSRRASGGTARAL